MDDYVKNFISLRDNYYSLSSLPLMVFSFYIVSFYCTTWLTKKWYYL